MEDTEIPCAVCGKPFLFTASEQAYYAERGFQYPKRCKTCRQARRKGGPGGGPRRGSGLGAIAPAPKRADARRVHPTTCGECEAEHALAFPLAAGATAVCADCFRERYG